MSKCSISYYINAKSDNPELLEFIKVNICRRFYPQRVDMAREINKAAYSEVTCSLYTLLIKVYKNKLIYIY